MSNELINDEVYKKIYGNIGYHVSYNDKKFFTTENEIVVYKDENIDNIINLLKDRKSVENKAYLASYDEVKDNDYNISVNSYLKVVTEEEKIDIKELNEQIKEIVEKEDAIRKELDKIVAELESDSNE